MSTRVNIGGALNYDVLANLNRPKSADAIAIEVRRLAGTGLKAVDISTALRLNLTQVREILATNTLSNTGAHGG